MSIRPHLSIATSLVKPKPCGPVEAFLPAIVWRASQCGWIRVDETEHRARCLGEAERPTDDHKGWC